MTVLAGGSQSTVIMNEVEIVSKNCPPRQDISVSRLLTLSSYCPLAVLPTFSHRPPTILSPPSCCHLWYFIPLDGESILACHLLSIQHLRIFSLCYFTGKDIPVRSDTSDGTGVSFLPDIRGSIRQPGQDLPVSSVYQKTSTRTASQRQWSGEYRLDCE